MFITTATAEQNPAGSMSSGIPLKQQRYYDDKFNAITAFGWRSSARYHHARKPDNQPATPILSPPTMRPATTVTEASRDAIDEDADSRSTDLIRCRDRCAQQPPGNHGAWSWPSLTRQEQMPCRSTLLIRKHSPPKSLNRRSAAQAQIDAVGLAGERTAGNPAPFITCSSPAHQRNMIGRMSARRYERRAINGGTRARSAAQAALATVRLAQRAGCPPIRSGAFEAAAQGV